MAYTKTVWVSGLAPGIDAAELNNLETQYESALADGISDDVYAAGWDGVVDVAPSKNAVYDKIESLEFLVYTDYQYYDDLAFGTNYTPPAKAIAVLLRENSATAEIVPQFFDGSGWNTAFAIDSAGGAPGITNPGSLPIMQDVAQSIRIANLSGADDRKIMLSGVTWSV